ILAPTLVEPGSPAGRGRPSRHRASPPGDFPRTQPMRACMTPAAALWFLLAGGSLFAGERIDYLRDVKPILAARCYACHGAFEPRWGLRLDTAALIRKGGDAGPAVEPGKSSDSLLVERITGNNGVRRMPPESEGEPLKEQEIARIKAWIDQGAVNPP